MTHKNDWHWLSSRHKILACIGVPCMMDRVECSWWTYWIDPSRGIYMIQMVNFVSCKHAMRLNHRPLFQSNLCISWKCVRESASHYVVAIEYQHIYNSRIRIFIINDTGRQCRIIAYVLINWLYMKDHYLVWCWWGRLYYVFNLQWDECI